jgi:DNA-binding MarR family transcriptional regulator
MLRLPAALDTQLQRDAGISSFEYQVLSGLSVSPERTMRMSRLAALTEGSLSRLSQVVARLEKRGWGRRTQPLMRAIPSGDRHLDHDAR